MEITLPFPPSVNTYWRTYQGRMLISAKGRLYRQTVCDIVKVANLAAGFAGKLRISIEARQFDKRRRDLDNLLKAPLDALCHAGVYKDDSQIIDLRIYWGPSTEWMLKVTITEDA